MPLHEKVKRGENQLDDVYSSIDLSGVLPTFKMPEQEHSPRHIYQVMR